jgi:chromosome segregation ATPase
MQNAIIQGERVESAQLVIDDLAQQVAQQEALREEAERLRTVAQERAVELTTSNAGKEIRLAMASRAREVVEEQVNHLVKRLEKRSDCINDQTEQIHDLKARLQVCHAGREKLLNNDLKQRTTIDQLLETQARWDSACGILKGVLVFIGVAAVLLSIVIPRL